MSTLKTDTLSTVSGSGSITVSTDLTASGNATANSINLGGRSLGAGGTPLGVNFSSAVTNGMQINDTNSGNLGGMMGFYSGSGAGTNRANIQNANNAGIHVCVGTSGSVTFGALGYTAANARDDYEEGTWTPTYDTGFPAGSPEEVVQGAKYVKVGSLVHCILRLQARNDGTSMQLGGLPFVPNCDGGFGTVGHDSHTTRKERIFSGNSWIAWVYSGTSGSLVNHYFTITYTTDS